MAFVAFLYVNTPVASLQFDLDTQGSIVLDPSIQKQIFTNRMTDGKLRVIIFGLDQIVFSGRFASAGKPISSIANIVGSSLDGSNANASVTKMSSPQGVTVSVKK